MKKINSLLYTALLSFAIHAQSGPGGVGSTDDLNVWLRVDKDFIEDNINDISKWHDQGPELFSLIAGGNQRPTFNSSDINYNGRPTLSFDGVNNVLTLANPSNFDSPQMTLFLVGQYDNVINNAWQTFVSKTWGPSWADGWGLTQNNTSELVDFWVSDYTNNAQIAVDENTPSIFTGRFDQQNVSLNLNAGTDDNFAHTSPIQYQSSHFYVGKSKHTYNLEGKIAEVIKYNKALNESQQIIIQNYLSSRYNIAIDAVIDRYDYESTSSNGLIGIGQESSSDSHESSQGCGILTIDSPSDLDDGEYALIGHNGNSLNAQTTDIPNIYNGTPNRLQRVWRVDKTGDLGKVRLQFDLSNSGFIYAEDQYELLIDPDGDFDANNNYRRHIIGRDLDLNNVLSFNAVELNDGDYFTLVAGTPYSIDECPCDNNYLAFTNCSLPLNSQTPNYRDPIPGLGFIIDEDVVYSSAPEYGQDLNGVYQDLRMDIYTPCNEETLRPLVLICSGGGYNTSRKCSKRVQYRAKQLAARGYVVAAFEYRSFLGTTVDSNSNCSSNQVTCPTQCVVPCPPPTYQGNCLNLRDYMYTLSSNNAEKAGNEMSYKMAQDGRAAIRYLKQKASDYDINPNQVFITGNSAGGGVTLNTLFYDFADQPDNWLVNAFGDLDATAHNSVSNSITAQVLGGISIAGFLEDKTYLDLHDYSPLPAIAFFHGTWDDGVHYQKSVSWGGSAYGSEALAEHIENNPTNIPYKLWSVCESGHTLLHLDDCKDDPLMVDFNHTLEMHAVQFFYDILNSQVANSEVTNNSVHDFNNPGVIQGNVNNVCPSLIGGNNHCPSTVGDLQFIARKKSPGIALSEVEQYYGNGFELYPNPNSGIFTMSYKSSVVENSLVNIYSVNGKLIKSVELKLPKQQLDLSKLNGGIYIVEYNGQFKKLVLNK